MQENCKYRFAASKSLRQPLYRADGTPLNMAGVSIDITARKRGEEHRALLAGELNHRVKNSMATMQSIAYQTLRSASSLEEARKSLESRLQSLAAAHDVLTRENWERATMAEVVDNALLPFRTKGGSLISSGGPDLRLSPRASPAYAMALHELATNAAKCGALSADIGRVIVNWTARISCSCDGKQSAGLPSSLLPAPASAAE